MSMNEYTRLNIKSSEGVYVYQYVVVLTLYILYKLTDRLLYEVFFVACFTILFLVFFIITRFKLTMYSSLALNEKSIHKSIQSSLERRIVFKSKKLLAHLRVNDRKQA